MAGGHDDHGGGHAAPKAKASGGGGGGGNVPKNWILILLLIVFLAIGGSPRMYFEPFIGGGHNSPPKYCPVGQVGIYPSCKDVASGN